MCTIKRAPKHFNDVHSINNFIIKKINNLCIVKNLYINITRTYLQQQHIVIRRVVFVQHNAIGGKIFRFIMSNKNCRAD